ncbi:hypothetical protein LO749_18720 [Paracoccus denitrificans]|uniref:hypothetical protein n=1 Tax=Paracoccus denitrificans TaxID=266 RepID=UPI001E580059|nr:hypothetical protein [Paracoccus denitrificans]UFS66542.1 hypothetical protein LO749_18720 [Paracoccus denitrificans]
MSDDLIERLRDFTEEDAYAMPWTFGAVVREAADELARLSAEVERLTAALSDERAHADAMAEALKEIADLPAGNAHAVGTAKRARHIAICARRQG